MAKKQIEQIGDVDRLRPQRYTQRMTTDNPQDIRWQQRLQNFQAAFNELDEAVALSNTRELSKLEEQGLIQAFEYTYELAWNTVKDFY
jgi:hypothetical protein